MPTSASVLGRAARGLGAGLLALASIAPGARAGRIRDDLDLLREDVRALTVRIAELEAENASLREQLTEVRSAAGLDAPGQATPADLSARFDSLERDIRVLFENQGQTARRLSLLDDKVGSFYRRPAAEPTFPDDLLADARGAETLVGEVASATGEGDAWRPEGTDEAAGEDAIDEGGTERAGGGPGAAPDLGTPALESAVDPEELYQTARADYGRGSYPMAIAGFRDFLDRFPTSDLADNAQYWIGECYYADGLYEHALAAFDSVVENYPEGDKTPDAEYKKALCLLELNHTADGIIQLQAVKDRHPDSAAARLARQKLQSLGLM